MNAIVWFLAVCVSSSLAMNYTDVKCHHYAPPKHGRLLCQKDTTASVYCYVMCNNGYDVEFLQAEHYICKPEGKWEVIPSFMSMPWPNCIEFKPGMPIP